MDLRAKIHQTLPWLLQKRTLWVILILLLISPPIWLGWTQPWQYQPQVPTGPLPEEVAQRPSYPLPPEIQAAKDEGMRLWGLHEWIKMQPYLKEAAEYGDPDAMYFLGEANRRLYHFNTEAMEWYVQGARAGEVYSMLRLHQAGICLDGTDTVVDHWCPESRQSWISKAFNQRLPDAEAGDTEAMLDVYTAGGSLRWLRLAAEADNPEAQVEVGMYIGDGVYPGWPYYRYWSKEARLRAALPWYRRAAELGYAPAMAKLRGTLHQLGERTDEYWYWIHQAALHGDISGNLGIAACYINPQDMPNRHCPVKQDVVKGYGILLAIKSQGAGRAVQLGLDRFSEIISTLNDEQRAQAEAFSHEWESRLKAPLSKFPPRWGL